MTMLFLKRSFADLRRDPFTDVSILMDSQTKEILEYTSHVPEHTKPTKTVCLNSHEFMKLTKSYAPPNSEEVKDGEL